MRDGPEIVGAGDDALGEQEAGGELAVGARGPHDHRERLAVQPDFERFLGGGESDSRRARPPRTRTTSTDRSALGHGVILPL